MTISNTIPALSHPGHVPREAQGGLALQGYATTRCGYTVARGIVGIGQERKRAAPRRPIPGARLSDLAMAPDSGLTAAEG